MSKLDYESPNRSTSPAGPWLALITFPILVVAVFALGSAILQDDLVDGDGLSWRKATLYTGIPSIIALVVLCTLCKRGFGLSTSKTAWILPCLMNATALSIIIWGIISAW